MSVIVNISNKAPFLREVVDETMRMTRVWQQWFRLVEDSVKYLGQEFNFALANNQSSAADIVGMVFDKSYTSFAVIEYVIQRVTSTTERVQSGCLHAVYRPDGLTWAIREYGTAGPDTSGITFSITSSGQVQYTSTNLGGTQEISRIVYRVRKIEAKSSIYSAVG